MTTHDKRIFPEIVALPLYASVVMIVVTLLIFLIRGIADGVAGGREPSPLTIGFGDAGILSPFVWLPGLALGLSVNLVRLKRRACWVWIVGALWLGFGIGNFILHFDPSLYQGCSAMEGVGNAFFTLNPKRCGGIVESGSFFSVPAICTASFALGAWLAILLRHNKINGKAA